MKNIPKVTDNYRNNYFQPGTPGLTHKCFSSSKLKSSPQNFLNKNTCNCDKDDTLKVPDSNILEILRETDSKVNVRGDSSPITKSFFTSPFNSSQRETTHGVNSIHVNFKAPVNGLTSEMFTKSSSGSDLTSHSTSHDTSGMPNEVTNETECLLVRHYSVGHLAKPSFDLTTAKDIHNYSTISNKVGHGAYREVEISNTNV